MSYIQPFNKKRKTIIFSCGPTGSGKGRIFKRTLDVLGIIELKDTFEKFLVDEYVERSHYYKDQIKNILDRQKCNNEDNFKCLYDNNNNSIINNDIIKEFETAYETARGDNYNGEVSCSQIDKSNPVIREGTVKEKIALFSIPKPEPKPKPEPEPEPKIIGCKQQMLIDLKNAISLGSNILIETTGKKMADFYFKLLKEGSNLDSYNIVFTFVLVEFETLKERNISRIKTAIIKFFQDIKEYGINNAIAPRLPDINDTPFKEKTSMIIDFLLKLKKCLEDNNQCKDIPKKDITDVSIDSIRDSIIKNTSLLVFDNNEVGESGAVEKTDTKLIYCNIPDNEEVSNSRGKTLEDLVAEFNLRDDSSGRLRGGRLINSKRKNKNLKKTKRRKILTKMKRKLKVKRKKRTKKKRQTIKLKNVFTK